jgi:hypothetical protein
MRIIYRVQRVTVALVAMVLWRVCLFKLLSRRQPRRPRLSHSRSRPVRSQFALIEIALFILGTPTDLKEMLPDTSSQRAEPAPSFHQY